ncbi:MAG: hypothetical protein WC659_01295 [Patescibacteria group bacterium]
MYRIGIGVFDRRRAWAVFAGILFFILAVFFHHFPDIRPADDFRRSVDIYADGLFVAWALDWDTDFLRHPHTSLFNAPIFAPYANTLAYSEHFLGAAIMMFPLTVITDDPTGSVAILVVLSTWLTGLATYMLARNLGAGTAGAYLAGVIAGFAPTRLNHAPGHLHMLMLWWIPLCLLALNKYRMTRSPAWLFFLGLCVVAQGLCSMHGLLLLLIALGVAAAAYGRNERSAWLWRLKAAVAAVIALAVLSPVIIPYLNLAGDQHFTRPLREQMVFAPALVDLLVPPVFLSQVDRENNVAPGLAPLLLFALGTYALCRWDSERCVAQRMVFAFFLLMLAGIVLALGPEMRVLKDGGLSFAGPYGILRYIPGFSGIRAVGRFAQLALLGLATYVGLTWQAVTVRLARWQKTAVTLIAFVFLLGEFFITAPRAYAVPDGFDRSRPVDIWLAQRAEGCTIAELPFDDIRTQENKSVLYMYLARHHGKRMVNGYSGYAPAGYSILERYANGSDEAEAIPLLQQLGADYVIVHPSFYSGLRGEEIVSRFNTDPGLKAEIGFPDSFVWRVLPEDPNCD